jgi:hypothetical protein
MNCVNTFLLVLICVLKLHYVYGQIPATPTGTLTDDNGNFNLAWFVDLNGGVIQFEMSALTQGWVAVGISNNPSGHRQTDSAIGFVDSNGQGVLMDASSNRRSQPIPDVNNDLTLISSSKANGITTIRFQRQLQIADPNNVDILNQPMTVAYAYGNLGAQNNLIFHSFFSRNDALNLLATGSANPVAPVISTGGDEEDEEESNEEGEEESDEDD